ncbi:MAG: glycosyltransferase [Thiofilum sp.]|uniref:glycosyltransferase n=1 Tax=Thiofilum sp. TaxID=2212733 RepID=UPI0025DCFA96|nr:glycosyltransferase [Thiofilum sp.]MBK8451879.1 glycosyltransferase [Thiofilum sp.]
MRKRIGLLIDSLIGGGAERITLNFAETFAKLGHDVHVFILKNEIHHVIDKNAYSIHILTENGVLSKFKLVNKSLLKKTFIKAISNVENDGIKFDFFISSSEDFDRIAKLSRLPNIFIRYRNSMSEFILSKVGNKTGWKAKERVWRHTLRHKSIYNHMNIVAITKAMQFDLCKKVGIKPKTITTIYNPFDFAVIRERANKLVSNLPSAPYIIYAAKFENRKNHRLLIDAYYKANPKHLLVLIGDVYTASDHETYENLKAQIHNLSLENRVILAGFQKNPYPWIKNADLFVMSSNNEGLPTVLIESLILGTPVVSVDCPTGPSEILTGELADYLSPVGDVDALATNITKALQHYPQIDDSLLAKFNSEYVAKQYIDHCTKQKN